jgi:hypothetical protein
MSHSSGDPKHLACSRRVLTVTRGEAERDNPCRIRRRWSGAASIGDLRLRSVATFRAIDVALALTTPTFISKGYEKPTHFNFGWVTASGCDRQ